MPDQLLTLITNAINMAVIERVDNGHFRLAAPPPSFFTKVFPEFSHQEALVDICNISPFLEYFIQEAEAHWASTTHAPLDSGPWTECPTRGNNVVLLAKALCVGEKKILIIEKPGKKFEYHRWQLQCSRENLLTQHHLENEVRKRTKEIRLREEEVCMRLVGATEYRDEETGTHVRRIGLFAEQLATHMGWGPQNCYELRVAAPMHDVGKIGIPDAILLKPARHTPQEREIMKTHTTIGGSMLEGSDIPLLNMARDIALNHHEQWDGKGYNGLAKKDIPESARITTVCDVFDALVNDRVYRPALPEHEALTIMRMNREKIFDPNILDVFLDILPTIRDIRLENSDPENSAPENFEQS